MARVWHRVLAQGPNKVFVEGEGLEESSRIFVEGPSREGPKHESFGRCGIPR